MQLRERENGFTLVEVLVALVILGMIALSVFAVIVQTARSEAADETRLFAGIVVDNLMVESLATGAPLQRGVSTGQVTQGGRAWRFTREVADSGVEGVVKITIAISQEGSKQTTANASTLKRERP